MDSYFFQNSLTFKRKLYFNIPELCIGPTFYKSCSFLHWFFKIYFIFGGAASLLLHMGFLSLQWARASHCNGFSCCRERLQELWYRVSPMPVGSSQTRDQTRVPCIGRWMLNHWTPREALHIDIYDHSLSPPFDINFLLIYEVLFSSFLIALPQTFL